ncbi:Gibberellin regulated protein, partial [Cynara cardunculus var. scolymus]
IVTGSAPNSSLQDIDCDEKCLLRCSKASRTKMCLRACGTCCERCHCVPPGTYGNYDTCPCYADLTTHEGRRKCP